RCRKLVYTLLQTTEVVVPFRRLQCAFDDSVISFERYNCVGEFLLQSIEHNHVKRAWNQLEHPIDRFVFVYGDGVGLRAIPVQTDRNVVLTGMRQIDRKLTVVKSRNGLDEASFERNRYGRSGLRLIGLVDDAALKHGCALRALKRSPGNL